MSALGHYQPLSIQPGDRLLSGAYQSFRMSLDPSFVRNVCFSRKRSFRSAGIEVFERLLTATSGHSLAKKNPRTSRGISCLVVNRLDGLCSGTVASGVLDNIHHGLWSSTDGEWRIKANYRLSPIYLSKNARVSRNIFSLFFSLRGECSSSLSSINRGLGFPAAFIAFWSTSACSMGTRSSSSP